MNTELKEPSFGWVFFCFKFRNSEILSPLYALKRQILDLKPDL